MPKYKTKKALMKRFKITKNNKIIHRPAGQDHFLAKKTGNQTRNRRGNKTFSFMAKTLKKRI
ncbi:MAG: 50S ribosomal protein L35 [Candidatus Portnoybacteria bacterium]|nr:50S ribosomal protein L35 [Candidatus Portnoybacteria bacterium]